MSLSCQNTHKRTLQTPSVLLLRPKPHSVTWMFSIWCSSYLLEERSTAPRCLPPAWEHREHLAPTPAPDEPANPEGAICPPSLSTLPRPAVPDQRHRRQERAYGGTEEGAGLLLLFQSREITMRGEHTGMWCSISHHILRWQGGGVRRASVTRRGTWMKPRWRTCT